MRDTGGWSLSILGFPRIGCLLCCPLIILTFMLALPLRSEEIC
jgi:hypothetical protein